jgi:hypothetical protein
MSTLNRREALILGSAAAAYGLAPDIAKAVEVEGGDEWAKIAARQFIQLGVTLVRNDDDNPAGVRIGDKIGNRVMFLQRHVDWKDEITDGKLVPTDIRLITAALGILTANVARSIGPSRKLKTFSLMLPKIGVYNSSHLAFGHLRLRFLQSYYSGDQGGDEGVINRIDILFPWQGV